VPGTTRDEDQRSYKVCNVADMQAVPAPPIDEYVSNSTVGSDNGSCHVSQGDIQGRHVAAYAADGGEDTRLPGRDPGRGGEEAEEEADQVRSVGRHDHD
jgi:hypothetical protein